MQLRLKTKVEENGIANGQIGVQLARIFAQAPNSTMLSEKDLKRDDIGSHVGSKIDALRQDTERANYEILTQEKTSPGFGLDPSLHNIVWVQACSVLVLVIGVVVLSLRKPQVHRR